MKQGTQKLLLRSRSSLKSLSPSCSGSESSFSMLSSDHASTPDRLGLHSIKRSSSSLYLQGLAGSTNSFHSQSLSIGEKEGASGSLSKFADDLSLGELVTLLPPHPSDSKALFQWLIIAAVTLHLPNFLEEAIELMGLHIHSIPLLLVLGALPQMLLKTRKKLNRNLGSQELSVTDNSMLFRSSSAGTSLDRVEEYYRNHHQATPSYGDNFSPAILKTVHQGGAMDDWGHFADFSESSQDDDFDFFMLPEAPQRASLQTLPETEDEE